MGWKINKKREECFKKSKDGCTSDTCILKSLNLTQQAVHQMRSRLEKLGIMAGYLPIINFKKVGMELFHFAGVKVNPSLWKTFSEFEINKKLCDIPFLFMAFRIPSLEISYLLIFGFKDIDEEEIFTKKLESSLSGEISIVWSYTSSTNNMLVYDGLNVVLHALNTRDNGVIKTVEYIVKK